MKILIVEDDAVMMMLFKVMVKKIGHSVICAQDGLEAFDLIEHTLPDIVITDMMLPGVSGPEIVNYVRRLRGKKIPVILVSSMLKIALKNADDFFGADAYLEKPVSTEVLKNTIEELREAMSFRARAELLKTLQAHKAL